MRAGTARPGRYGIVRAFLDGSSALPTTAKYFSLTKASASEKREGRLFSGAKTLASPNMRLGSTTTARYAREGGLPRSCITNWRAAGQAAEGRAQMREPRIEYWRPQNPHGYWLCGYSGGQFRRQWCKVSPLPVTYFAEGKAKRCELSPSVLRLSKTRWDVRAKKMPARAGGPRELLDALALEDLFHRQLATGNFKLTDDLHRNQGLQHFFQAPVELFLRVG